MPTMVERIAERILQEYENHELVSENEVLTDGDKTIMTGVQGDCNQRMKQILAERYARAALEELRKPDSAMLWARSKGYEAMIEAALKE